mgnify:CR=1 FL=1
MSPMMKHLKDIPVDQFASDIREVCGRFCVEPTEAERDFQGAITVRNTCGFDVAEVAQNSKSIGRSKRDIRRDPGDHFFLIRQEAGTAYMGQEDDLHKMTPGDMMLVDSTRPSMFRYNGETSCQLSLHLPRDEQQQRFGNRIEGGLHIANSNPLGQAIGSIGQSILTGDTRNEAHVTEAFYSVLGAYLMSVSLGESGPADANRLLVNRAVDIMSVNYTDPEFSVPHVADKLNVPLRRLQRAFQCTDDTARERLLNIRVHAAAQTLRSQRKHTSANIAQIAYANGFSDVSTFHRHFNAVYHKAPGQQLREWRKMQ